MFWILSALKGSSCRLKLVWDFASIVSLEYPWFMITIIAIDRYLIITKQSMVHTIYITKKTIFRYIFISILLTFTLAFWYLFTKSTGTWKFTIAFKVCLLVIFAEFVVIFSLYVHLVIFVYTYYKRMEGNRQDRTQDNYSIRTAKTVFLILLCLTSCNLIHAICLLIIRLDQSLKHKVVRNLFGWSALLAQLNSFFNALIIIIRNSEKQTTLKQVQNNLLTHSTQSL